MSRIDGKTGVTVAVGMSQYNGNLNKHRAVRRPLRKSVLGIPTQRQGTAA
jgi:hypothetical protein